MVTESSNSSKKKVVFMLMYFTAHMQHVRLVILLALLRECAVVFTAYSEL